MGNLDELLIEVAYASPDKQVVIPLKVKPGTTLEAAIYLSGILDTFPEINLETNAIGIFGKLNKLEYCLRDGDRVEIYRALIADPKEIRKKRAAEGKKMKKGGA